MNYIIQTFKCICGKMHCCAGVSPISICSCGENLWHMMYNQTDRATWRRGNA